MYAAARDTPRLVYLRGKAIGTSELVWYDRTGTELERTGVVGDLYKPEAVPGRAESGARPFDPRDPWRHLDPGPRSRIRTPADLGQPG